MIWKEYFVVIISSWISLMCFLVWFRVCLFRSERRFSVINKLASTAKTQTNHTTSKKLKPPLKEWWWSMDGTNNLYDFFFFSFGWELFVCATVAVKTNVIKQSTSEQCNAINYIDVNCTLNGNILFWGLLSIKDSCY